MPSKPIISVSSFVLVFVGILKHNEVPEDWNTMKSLVICDIHRSLYSEAFKDKSEL